MEPQSQSIVTYEYLKNKNLVILILILAPIRNAAIGMPYLWYKKLTEWQNKFSFASFVKVDIAPTGLLNTFTR